VEEVVGSNPAAPTIPKQLPLREIPVKAFFIALTEKECVQ